MSTAKNAILKAKIKNVISELMVKTTAAEPANLSENDLWVQIVE